MDGGRRDLQGVDGIPFTPLIAGDPLGQKSAATVDFPDRLTGPGCDSPVNAGNPNHYIKTQCFAFHRRPQGSAIPGVTS